MTKGLWDGAALSPDARIDTALGACAGAVTDAASARRSAGSTGCTLAPAEGSSKDEDAARAGVGTLAMGVVAIDTDWASVEFVRSITRKAYRATPAMLQARITANSNALR
jgi:hypothetical protein